MFIFRKVLHMVNQNLIKLINRTLQYEELVVDICFDIRL